MAQICLSLTGKSIEENLSVLELYRGDVDLVELRADYLDPGEMLHLRSFPERAGLPCILSVRRRRDGGAFDAGEGVRLVMMAKGLTHARIETEANFAYVDLELDFRVPAIEEACRIFGTRIIRSYHGAEGDFDRLESIWADLSAEPDEIPKIALTCSGVKDLARLFRWSQDLPKRERIIFGMGPYGFPARILADKMGSMLTYASALGSGLSNTAQGLLDPRTLVERYRFPSLSASSKVFALAGGAMVVTSRSPELHNEGFALVGMDAVCVPFPSEDIPAFFEAAEAAGVLGASISVPLKESVIPHLAQVSEEAARIGACNTILRDPGGWRGFNTDAVGFERDIKKFLGREDLMGLRVTVVGAGGAARAVASVLARLGAAGLILNRTLTKARSVARAQGFAWAANDERAHDLVAENYCDLIVNATCIGMEGGEPGDPLEWYEFGGGEMVYDLIYKPETSRLLERAGAAGCRVSNGFGMLRHQAAEQFRIWTGLEAPAIYFE